MTYRLLFPPRDREWLKGMIQTSQSFTPSLSPDRQRREYSRPCDKRLPYPAIMELPSMQQHFRRPIKSSSELFRRYPHWATRLHILFEEAEDPTPVSALDRWAERRKAPRHSFWVAAAAFAVGIFFGLVTTALGVIQIWISYCAWRPAGTAICGAAPTGMSS